MILKIGYLVLPIYASLHNWWVDIGEYGSKIDYTWLICLSQKDVESASGENIIINGRIDFDEATVV